MARAERETTNAISLLICDGALGEFLFLTISLEALGCERLSTMFSSRNPFKNNNYMIYTLELCPRAGPRILAAASPSLNVNSESLNTGRMLRVSTVW